jgi:uncharacterized protein YndB with AHSA1/START domain
MATVHHQLWINAPASTVYEAISSAEGLTRWWGPHESSDTEAGLVVSHNPGPEHGIVQLKVLNRVQNAHVEWECISTHPPSSPASAWAGTHFIWDITERDNVASLSGFGRDGDRITVLDFRQTGYDERSEFYGRNNFGWGAALMNLKQVVEQRPKA